MNGEEPKTVADLKLMRETSSGWFDGFVFNKAVNTENYEVGDVHSRQVCVSIQGDTITVTHKQLVCTEKRAAGGSFKTEYTGHEDYTFDEFRASEYWPMTMKAWRGGVTDASHLEHKHIYRDDRSVSATLSVQDTYRDGFGNLRMGKGHKDVEMTIHDDGETVIACGDDVYEGTLEELFEHIELSRRCKEHGISVGDDKLEVRLSRTEVKR